MQPSIQSTLERSFDVDLRHVRVHADEHAHNTARNLSARAVTFGASIFLGSGESPSDLPLVAHEVAHVVQQQGAPVTQPWTINQSDPYEREAHQASAAVLLGESFKVRQQTGPRPQTLLDIDIGIPDPLDWLAGKANIIPGFRMFTIILGVNPINMSPVARSAANILRALIEFLPGGGLITQALDNAGVFEKAGTFVETQIATLGMTGSAIKAAVTAFIAGLSLRRIITDPGGVWESAKSIFTDPIDRIKSFGKGLVTGIIEIVKDAILKPIAKLAEGTEGYNLLKGILGKDPITGDPVTRSAETLLGPLLKMIGLGDVWEKMQQARAIPRCWAWFQSTISQLFAIVSQIPPSFIAAFKSLTLEDIILVPKAFIKLGKVFVGFLGKFVSWGVNAMWNLLEIVFDVVSPGAFGYVKKTGAALKSILKNPLPFVGNLVKAAKAGFLNFGAKFLTHLKAGLLDWLVGSLPGVYIPKALSLVEFGKLALSVFGITWAQIRAKIVKALGPNGETIMKGLELAFDVIKALVRGGPAAAWEVIKDKLTNLKDMIVDGIVGFIKDTVVTKAIPKLIAMFIPGAGFISAIISIYDTVMVFVQKISKIIQVVTAFINSIVAIAAGNIGAAAAKVESILAGLLALAINFLAGFVGLGKAADKIREVINKVRGTVDKALDTAINWIVTRAKSLFAKLFGKTKPGEPDSETSKDLKKRLKAELGTKKITDSQQAATLISGLYSKYSAQGLQGIRLIYDPKKPEKAGIKVSASIAEVIANLSVDKQGLGQALRYARQFNYLASSTVLYAYYDTDNKPYGGAIRNASNYEHAEQVFKNKYLSGLKKQIQADRNAGKLKTPAGQPVKVELNLNRVPCPICSPILAALSSMNPDLRFVVKASSASNTASAEITTEYIEKMLAGGVEVNTLKIFEAIQDKIVEILKASRAKEIALTPNDFVQIEVALPMIRENLSKEQALQSMINQATQKLQKNKTLTEVSPMGSGV
ncbi:MAG TPA: DUF4157 domain-containing protein [Anaerolineales bacterium]|nr:DUF4157 domain-containing protein [Anaerolineales bacterium]